jgi:hypothetical protein
VEVPSEALGKVMLLAMVQFVSTYANAFLSLEHAGGLDLLGNETLDHVSTQGLSASHVDTAEAANFYFMTYLNMYRSMAGFWQTMGQVELRDACNSMAENAQAAGAIYNCTEHDIDNDYVLHANDIVNDDVGSDAPEMAHVHVHWGALLRVLKRLSRTDQY